MVNSSNTGRNREKREKRKDLHCVRYTIVTVLAGHVLTARLGPRQQCDHHLSPLGTSP
ncbi:hypothetical protein LX36DRAFT_340909 [Colletotrichum falcatum]|nr:hypothetical protein LX36DRAFT_340909 [Colletotrichum falcatum]